MLGWWRRRRRRRWLAAPVPEGWRGHLERRAPFFRALPVADQARLLSLTQAFLAEHPVVGAGGMEVTEEVAVVVGACAARLVLGLDLDHYARLTEVVVYPHEALRDPRAEGAAAAGGGFLGAAHRHGAVVLSWPAVLRGLSGPGDGHDTAAHEFAHALDLVDGAFDGAPGLRAAEHYRPWASVLGAHFSRLSRGDRRLRRALREYGATNPAEFFAVATEAFFERPRELRRQAPALYAELARFYGRGREGEEEEGPGRGIKG